MQISILVVEDEPAIRVAIQGGLESEGYRVFLAADVAEAQSILCREHIQAVVLDWMLGSEIDGLELCRRLKTHPATRRLPVIMLTAKSRPERRREAERAGVDAFLPKPFDLHDLLDALQRTLGGGPELAEASGSRRAEGASKRKRWKPREYLVGLARLQMPDGRLTHRETGAVGYLRRAESWLMELLASYAGVVPHGVLCREVQQHRGGDPLRLGALRETIRQINRTLRQIGLPEIQSQRGIGYRWLAHRGEPSVADIASVSWEVREYLVGPARLLMPDGRLMHRETEAVVQLRCQKSWLLEALACHEGVVAHEALIRAVQERRGGGGQMRVGTLREAIGLLNRELRQIGLPEIQAQAGIGYRWLAHEEPASDRKMTTSGRDVTLFHPP